MPDIEVHALMNRSNKSLGGKILFVCFWVKCGGTSHPLCLSICRKNYDLEKLEEPKGIIGEQDLYKTTAVLLLNLWLVLWDK